MIKETVLSRSIRLAFVGGVALGMQAAYAQEAAPDAPPLQKVEVTGSRIPTLNTEGASPVTVLSAKDIKIDGPRNVEDLLNNMPQVFATQGAAISNGASGTATVDLRGMGSQRTLVLVNGKRLPAGSVLNSSADLNEIPAALIKRVDILTGGAGAVYGSGAVSGVVNFIMKDNFEGVEVQGNVSGYNHQQHSAIAAVVTAKGYAVPGDKDFDGQKKDASILMGGNFDNNKGNATLFVSYKQAKALLESERDYSACSLGSTSKGFACSGSGTSIARIVNNNAATAYTPDASGNPRPYVSATDAYNFGPINFFQRPSDQYNVNAQMHYDVNDQMRFYNEFNFHEYSTDAQIAAGGIFFGQQATLQYDNPLLSPAWKAALGLTPTSGPISVTVGKRNTEGGPRSSYISDSSFREVIGVKGDVSDWSYDIFGQFARVVHQDRATGYFSNRLIAKALDVVPDAKGNAVCRSFLNGSDPNCVPYNLYAVGGISQAALNYLQVSGSNTGYTQQSIFGGTLATDLGRYGIKLPGNSNGVGISLGYEQRVEKVVFSPDAENQAGDLSGSGGVTVPVAGSYNVKEAFGEVKVPLLEKMAMVESLDLSGSYRRSNYSTGKDTNTYGFGLDWAPIKSGLRLRGSVQRAVRAPNIFELYSPQAVSLGGPANDPCGGPTPTATQAQCANTGLSAAQYGKVQQNTTSQYNSLNGGNPNLNPETADTITLGIVLEPVKNLTITVDAFHLKIKNAISTASTQIVFNQCLTTGSPTYCSLIHRDSLGSLWLLPTGYVSATNLNIGSQGTSGADIGAAYRMKLDTMGALDYSLNGTYVKTFTVEPLPGLGTYDCTGLFGATCGTPTPKWRHKARVTWSTPWSFDVSGSWRYFSSVTNDGNDANPLLAHSGVTPVDARLPSMSFFDLNASYRLTKKTTLSLGVNNLFDKDPPIGSSASLLGSFANGNTYPQVYDAYGRFIYFNVTHKF